MPTINGKRVINLPNAASGNDIINAVGESRPNRRVIVQRPEGNVTIDPFKKQKINEDDKIQITPDRVKASYEEQFTYGAKKKSEIVKQIIFDQVNDIEQKFFKNRVSIEIDEHFNWIKIPSFTLPEAWARVNNRRTVPILIIIPDDFPSVPTNGFYMPKDVVAPSQDTHFRDRGYGGAFGNTEEERKTMLDNGWQWYCSHILPEAWSPAKIRQISDWRKGDNLWDILTQIKDVLTDPSGD
jgi:hypothetical protein